MKDMKWWDLAFGTAVVALGVIVGLSAEPGAASARAATSSWGAWFTLAALAACYVTFGRRAFGNDRIALAFMVALIVGGGILTWFSPTMATFQALAMPLIWRLAVSIRQAIIVNLAFAISVAVGTMANGGWGRDAIAQAVIVGVLSMIFSIALGLWISRIAHFGAERARLLEELTAVQDELAAANRDAGVVSERERIAREIHDTIAQSLTSLVMLAQRARSELGWQGTDAAAETVEFIESTARDALTEARSLVAALAPLPVGESTLADVLARLADRFTRETGVRVSASVTASATPIPRELEVVLLRCAQEALANVRKHAAASEALVRIDRAGALVRLEVRDNGRGLVGYSPGAESGFGLDGMRERVSLVGGRLEVAGAPGEGTTLTATIPVHAEVGI